MQGTGAKASELTGIGGGCTCGLQLLRWSVCFLPSEAWFPTLKGLAAALSNELERIHVPYYVSPGEKRNLPSFNFPF